MAGLVRQWTDAWNACDVVFAAPQPTRADALSKAGLTEDDRIFEWEA